jgi:hypothetical protein
VTIERTDGGGFLYSTGLSRIEAGTRTPSLSALLAVADRLGTTARYLATGATHGRCPLCGRD